MSMLQFMCDVLNEKAGGNGRGGGAAGPYQLNRLSPTVCLSQQEWKILEEAVKTLKVRISHRPGTVRVYRVNSLRESADSLW